MKNMPRTRHGLYAAPRCSATHAVETPASSKSKERSAYTYMNEKGGHHGIKRLDDEYGKRHGSGVKMLVTWCRCRHAFCPASVVPNNLTTGTLSTALPAKLLYMMS